MGGGTPWRPRRQRSRRPSPLFARSGSAKDGPALRERRALHRELNMHSLAILSSLTRAVPYWSSPSYSLASSRALSLFHSPRNRKDRVTRNKQLKRKQQIRLHSVSLFMKVREVKISNPVDSRCWLHTTGPEYRAWLERRRG